MTCSTSYYRDPPKDPWNVMCLYFCRSDSSSWFAALENLNVDEDVNRVWENSKEKSKPQLKRAWVCMNGSSINHGLTKNV